MSIKTKVQIFSSRKPLSHSCTSFCICLLCVLNKKHLSVFNSPLGSILQFCYIWNKNTNSLIQLSEMVFIYEYEKPLNCFVCITFAVLIYLLFYFLFNIINFIQKRDLGVMSMGKTFPLDAQKGNRVVLLSCHPNFCKLFLTKTHLHM